MAGKLTGLQTVIGNLNKEKVVLHQKSLKGLIDAAIIVRRATDKEMPKIPVDTGNLRASWFATTIKSTTKGGTFKGKDAAELKSGHSQVVSIAKGAVSAIRHPALIMGFSANYAAFVHEMEGAQFSGRKGKKSGREGSGAKFFESAINNHKGEILGILAKNTYIK